MGADDELERLVGEHSALITAAIKRVCARRYPHVVADVRQDVHLAIWRQLKSGKSFDHPASYLYKVALTTALRTVRRLVREKEVVDEASYLQGADTTDPAAADLGLDKKQRLEAALAGLPEQNSRAVRAYLLGFNHEEVAELLDVSKSAARHLVYRGIAKLKAAVVDAGDQGDG